MPSTMPSATKGMEAISMGARREATDTSMNQAPTGAYQSSEAASMPEHRKQHFHQETCVAAAVSVRNAGMPSDIAPQIRP